MGKSKTAEDFVRAFKRDYARLCPLPDACCSGSDGWFNDCNHDHPHSGLGVRLPREFIGAQQPAKVSA